MKVTRVELKKIIKEEIEAVMAERGKFRAPVQAKDITASGPMSSTQKATQDAHKQRERDKALAADIAANSTKENCQQLSAKKREAWLNIETDSSAHTRYGDAREAMKKYKCKEKFEIT
tara:strand:+ start:190 stop:543 length:354 start_codon:yes stop_codon:yes gene_type:complete